MAVLPSTRSAQARAAVAEQAAQQASWDADHYRSELTEALAESAAALELALEDAGWVRLAAGAEQELSPAGLRRIASLCRLMAISNPLIKRGLALRTTYTWGQGVEVTARANGDNGTQDVNAVIQKFWTDRSNKRVLTGAAARTSLDTALSTDGNLFLALFTAPRTGRVQARSLPFAQIADIVTNPQDRSEPWYYLREVPTESGSERTAHPALGYHPPTRPSVLDGGWRVLWDAPVRHIVEQRPDGWLYGVPPAYAAIDWARAYKVFLEDWARLVKSLSRFAWRLTAKGSANAAAAKARAAAAPTLNARGEPLDVGATAVTTPNVTLEAIPKSGATIDSGSGQPLANMVAAALDVPVTMLLSDPGQTGARAVAETLDRPTELAMELRRDIWADALLDILDHVIDAAVAAGRLTGTISRVDGERVVDLADDGERVIDLAWPELDDLPVNVVVDALVKADATGKVPPLTVARLLLQALGVRDVESLLDEMTDEQGRWIDPAATAGQAAVDAFNRGEDPASRLDEPEPVPEPEQEQGARRRRARPRRE